MIDWISVEDRLPEDGQEIMVQCDNRTVCKTTFYKQSAFTGITHWYPYNPPTKKRWSPRIGEVFWLICGDGGVVSKTYNIREHDNLVLLYTGCFKTRDEAIAMRDKIREFVTSQIGSV